MGQLGLGNTKNQYKPITIENIEKIRQISCGYSHSLLLAESGRVYHNNFSGQLISIPLGDIKIKHIECGGEHSLLLGEDRKVYCFGKNNFGQLGLGHNNEEYDHLNLPSNDPIESNISMMEHTNEINELNNKIEILEQDLKKERKKKNKFKDVNKTLKSELEEEKNKKHSLQDEVDGLKKENNNTKDDLKKKAKRFKEKN